MYVVPEARGTGVSWRLVEAAAALATQEAYLQLYYWVGTDNGRAVGFANNFGFRITDYRRPSRNSDLEPGEDRHGAFAGARRHVNAEPDEWEASHPRRPPQLRPGRVRRLFEKLRSVNSP